MNITDYLELKYLVIRSGYSEEYEWACNIKMPEKAVELFSEYAWVVINSGMKEQIARKIWNKVKAAIINDIPVRSVFGHPGKSKAIQDAWENQERLFQEFLKTEDILQFCENLPWIGKITKYHLAKNLGADVVKPDRWLIRVSEETGETPFELCKKLSTESGDPVTAVDTIIWRGCNLGLWDRAHCVREMNLL